MTTTRLAYPDPAHVAEVMQDFPPALRQMRIGQTLSHAPTLLVPYYNAYGAVLQELELDPKLRQLAILRVAERAAAPYVLAQHRPLARMTGLTDDQIAAAGNRSPAGACFTYVQSLVLAFADEVVDGLRVSDVLFERIRKTLSPREIVELLLVIGWYWTACRLTTALELEPEHALAHGLVSMLRAEQAQRSDQPAADARPDDYFVY